MEGYRNWGSWTIFSLLKIILFLNISSHCLHVFSAEEQQKQYKQLSSTPKADESKPSWPDPIPWPNPFTFPIRSNPDTRNDHDKEDDEPKACNCNCKCDCPKIECKTENTAGPVVCLPMTCEDDNGCTLGGGMDTEAGKPFRIPYFGVAGRGKSSEPSKSSASMNTTAAAHH